MANKSPFESAILKTWKKAIAEGKGELRVLTDDDYQSKLSYAMEQGYRNGVRAAASVADQYNSSTTHKYRLGDCILKKLNMLGTFKRVRQNGQRIEMPNE